VVVDTLDVGLTDAVTDGDDVALSDTEGVAVVVDVVDTELVEEREGDAVGVAVTDALSLVELDGEAVSLGVVDGEAVSLGVVDGEAVSLGVVDVEAVEDSLAVEVPEGVIDGAAVDVSEAVLCMGKDKPTHQSWDRATHEHEHDSMSTNGTAAFFPAVQGVCRTGRHHVYMLWDCRLGCRSVSRMARHCTAWHGTALLLTKPLSLTVCEGAEVMDGEGEGVREGDAVGVDDGATNCSVPTVFAMVRYRIAKLLGPVATNMGYALSGHGRAT
jgi:hypothetical protein